MIRLQKVQKWCFVMTSIACAIVILALRSLSSPYQDKGQSKRTSPPVFTPSSKMRKLKGNFGASPNALAQASQIATDYALAHSFTIQPDAIDTTTGQIAVQPGKDHRFNYTIVFDRASSASFSFLFSMYPIMPDGSLGYGFYHYQTAEAGQIQQSFSESASPDDVNPLPVGMYLVEISQGDGLNRLTALIKVSTNVTEGGQSAVYTPVVGIAMNDTHTVLSGQSFTVNLTTQKPFQTVTTGSNTITYELQQVSTSSGTSLVVAPYDTWTDTHFKPGNTIHTFSYRARKQNNTPWEGSPQNPRSYILRARRSDQDPWVQTTIIVK